MGFQPHIKNKATCTCVFGFLCIKEENFNLPSRSYCVYLTSSPCLKILGYCAKCTAACTVSNDVKVENVTSVVYNC